MGHAFGHDAIFGLTEQPADLFGLALLPGELGFGAHGQCDAASGEVLQAGLDEFGDLLAGEHGKIMLVSGQTAHAVDHAVTETVAQKAPRLVDDQEAVASDDRRGCAQCGHAHHPALNVGRAGVRLLLADDVHRARAQ